MRMPHRLPALLFAACLALLPGSAPFAAEDVIRLVAPDAAPVVAEAEFLTPEDAIAVYLQGVAALDLQLVLSATAVEEMGAGYDFLFSANWLGTIVPSGPVPGRDQFFARINEVQFTTAITGQLKFLVLSLLTTSELVTNKIIFENVDREAKLIDEADLTRLNGLKLERIAPPNPALMSEPRYVTNASNLAKIYGADESTERVALLAFEGGHYVIGFRLLRYGETWKINMQGSSLGGTNVLGSATPTTPEEFDAALK